MRQMKKWTVSIASYLRNRFPKWRSPQEKLIAKSEKLAKKLFSQQIAQEELEKARSYADSPSGPNRWQTWNWLIRNHRSAHNQLKNLSDTLREIEKAEQCKGPNKEQFVARFVSSFSHLAQPGCTLDDLKALKELIESCRESWKKVEEITRDIKPPVFVTHAFLRFSYSSGIEISSMFIGGLIALGAIYMAFYYESATGQSVTAYWTLNDLIIQGILVVPSVVVAVLFAEALFFLYRKWTSRKKQTGYQHSLILGHSFILKHSFSIVFVFFLFTALVAATYGYLRGTEKLLEFNENLKSCSLQMATVMDNTVLNDVYLVGTTDRTAIFFQATKKDHCKDIKRSSFKDIKRSSFKDIKRRSFINSARSVIMAFMPCQWSDPDKNYDSNFEVLVMDRALVVCHAEKGKCETSKVKDGQGSDSGQLQVSLEEIRVLVGEESANMKVYIDQKFEGMDSNIKKYSNTDTRYKIQISPPPETGRTLK